MPNGTRAALIGASGNTLLVQVRLRGVPDDTSSWAKLESVNPGGSIKDRPAARIIGEARKRGVFDGGATPARLLVGQRGHLLRDTRCGGRYLRQVVISCC